MAIELRSGTSGAYDWAGGSDVGPCRDHNEDAFGAHVKKGIFAVADGCGGASSGSLASRIVIDVLTSDAEFRAGSAAEPLVQRIHDAHRAVIETAGRFGANGAQTGLGSTVVALCLRPPLLCTAHVGDCRVGRVLTRNTPTGLKKSIAWLNYSHRLWHEAVRSGEPAEVVASYRENLNNVVVHALGVDGLPDVEVRYSSLTTDSLFLLCSDGIWEQLSRDEIATIAADESLTLSERVAAMLKAASDAGGQDNATAMLVRYRAS